jgi:hypothetical protein
MYPAAPAALLTGAAAAEVAGADGSDGRGSLASGPSPPESIELSPTGLRRRSDWTESDAADTSSGTDVMPNSNHSGSSLRTSGGMYDSDSGNGGRESGGGGISSSGSRVKKELGRRQFRNQSVVAAKAARGAFDSKEASRAEVTTSLYIMNVPVTLTQGALISMFEDLTPSMRSNFDFFYCPWNEKEWHNLGSAVINFPDEKQAASFQAIWQNRELIRGQGQKLRVVRSSIQGLQANLEHFSTRQVVPCSELRFRPLFRDASGNLRPIRSEGEGPEERSEALSRAKHTIPEDVEVELEPPSTCGNPSAGQGQGGGPAQPWPQPIGYSQPPWQQPAGQAIVPGTAILTSAGGVPYTTIGYPAETAAGTECMQSIQRYSSNLAAGPLQSPARSQPPLSNCWGQPQDGSEPPRGQQVQFPQVVCYMMVPVEAMLPVDGNTYQTFAPVPGALPPQAAMTVAGVDPTT